MKRQSLPHDADALQAVLYEKARKRSLLMQLLPLVGLLTLVVVFSISTGGVFIEISNLENLVSQGFTLILIAAGAAFIYACGNIDMSVGAVFGLTEVVAGLAMSHLQVPGWLALCIAIGVGVMCTSVTAMTYSLLNVPPFVASLCMMNICNGLISWIVEDGEVYVTYSLYRHWNGTPVRVAALLFILVLGFFLFNKTRIGKDAKAMGGNKMTAIISGVKATRATWICYALFGICIGIAGFFGIVQATRVSSGSNTMALNIITAVVLGGFPLRGGASAKFHAAIVGAATVTVLNNGLTLMGLDPAVTLMVKGVLFLMIVSATKERKLGKLVK